MQILVMFSFINIPKLRKPALCEKVRALKTLKNLFLFALGIFVWYDKCDNYAKKKVGRGQILCTAFILYMYCVCICTVYVQWSSGDGEAYKQAVINTQVQSLCTGRLYDYHRVPKLNWTEHKHQLWRKNRFERIKLWNSTVSLNKSKWSKQTISCFSLCPYFKSENWKRLWRLCFRWLLRQPIKLASKGAGLKQ